MTHITRIAVGGLFIFSGFIKANDPSGFSYKLEEYFEVFGQGFSCDMKLPQKSMSGIPCEKDAGVSATTEAPKKPSVSVLKPLWDWFGEHSLFLAIFICAFEMGVGLFLLLGIKVRWTLFLLLAMIVFFAFLTFYSACCNKVTSCGCFGDAIKLTPWESFWKDLILLILIAVLFVGEKNISPLFKNSILIAGIAGIGLFASFAFPVYTWRHLPVIDFRPYAIGTNLWTASHSKDPKTTGCVTDSTYSVYYYQNQRTGAMMHFHSLDSIPEDTIWQFFCRDDRKVRTGNCGATVMDFILSDADGNDLTDSLLQMKGIQFFLVMYDIDKTETSDSAVVNRFYSECAKNNVVFNGLSNGSGDQVDQFRKKTGAKFPMLTVDGTALKTVIRSNPGLVMLKDGTVTAMWHINDFPAYGDVMAKYGGAK
ncbi:MAG TPA: BT_3928 family protein [Bacteroidia bacterium]|nr:BT_3928 family protein [Bacteroidia bacterium]